MSIPTGALFFLIQLRAEQPRNDCLVLCAGRCQPLYCFGFQFGSLLGITTLTSRTPAQLVVEMNRGNMASGNHGGRPTKLTKEIIQKAWGYVETAKDTTEIMGDVRPVVVNNVNLPTIEGLATYIGTNRDTLYEWEKQNDEFSDILTRVRQEQAQRLINNGLAGKYNPVIAKLLLSKHGYIERQEQDISHSGDVTFVNDIPRPKKDA